MRKTFTLIAIMLFALSAFSQSSFTPGNLVVLQTSGTASKVVSPVTLKEYTTNGVAGISVSIPSTGPTAFQTAGIFGGSEGFLTTSTDGKFLVMGGYSTTATTGDVTATSASSVPRVIGTVSASGVYTQVGSSTTSYSLNDIRGAISDGTNYWASGASVASVDGINYYGPGAPAALAVGATPPKAYGLRIFNGQIYYSTQKAGPSNSASQLGIFSLGNGLPTSGTVVPTQLINTGTLIPEDFSINPTTDICYIAINLNTSAGGIQKWIKNAGVWSLAYTLGTGVANTGAYGLVVDYSGSNPVIYATTFDATGNRVIKIVDNGTLGSAVISTIVPATSNVFFKGISFAPVDASLPSFTSVDLSTYVRVGRYDLPEPTRTAAPVNSLLAQEASAVTYNWDTQTLFVVGDGGTSIVQVTKTGQLVNSMTLAPGSSPQGTDFYDPEGLTYIGNGKFVMSEERDRQAVLFTYIPGGTLTRSATQTVKLGTFVQNIGIEGISYDPLTSGYICVKEKDPQGIFQTGIDFNAGTATNGSPTTENSVNLFNPALANLLDFADVYALSNLPALNGQPQYNNLLVLSQESGKIVNIDRSGNISSSLTIVSDPGNPLDVPAQQHEGLTMDRDGNLYVVSENGGGDFDHPQLWVYAHSNVPNQAPTAISLSNKVDSLLENSSTSSSIKVADIVIMDDALGTNNLTLSGPDSSFFEIINTGLYIKAGTVLDYETKNSYTVTINADDPSVGSAPDASTTFTLHIKDVTNEIPQGSTVIISEVAPWSSGNSPLGADWFEVTNTGVGTVNITGWKVDDNSGSPAAAVALNGITSIAPGESVIFIESADPATVVPAFKSLWFGTHVPAGLQIGTYTGSGIGLSTGGDAVNLYNGSGVLQASVIFGSSPTGPFTTFDNAAGLNNTTISQFSAVGINGAFTASDDAAEIGSPGTIVFVNKAPTVSITNPITGNPYNAGTINLDAQASDIDGTVTKVEFYDHGVKFAEDTTAPYGFTSEAVEPGDYVLTAKATDNNGATTVSDTVKITVAGCTGSGSISAEGFNNIPGGAVSDLTSNPAYPNNPDITASLNKFEYGNNLGDNYGARVRGYICAPVTGDYTFYIAGDDQAGLWLSTDDNPANKVLIAYNVSWVAPRAWFTYPTQKSASIKLVKGARYYIETLHKEYVGSDHLSVAWTIPGGIFEAPIPGNRLSPWNSSASNNSVLGGRSFAVAMEMSNGQGLQVTVSPNPSQTYFTLTTRSSNDQTIMVIVRDVLGKVVERKIGAVNGSIQVGGNLHAGIYFAEVWQGSQKQRLKLVKQ